MKIGDKIKERRLELGYSVDQIADMIGKNRATIYRYENNEIENLPTTVLEPLAKVLMTTPAHLLGWEDKYNPNEKLCDIIDKTSKNIAEYFNYDIDKINNFNYYLKHNCTGKNFEEIMLNLNCYETKHIMQLKKLSDISKNKVYKYTNNLAHIEHEDTITELRLNEKNNKDK